MVVNIDFVKAWNYKIGPNALIIYIKIHHSTIGCLFKPIEGGRGLGLEFLAN